ncbi:MAG: KTSC domain-containing protein [Kiritimatiellae bacterium]|nr:KTSC domain-containing protein [Kiritimatiellia bacterium]
MWTRRMLLWLWLGATAGAHASEPVPEAGSLIRSFSYDAKTQTLTIVMAKDGRAYRYLRVPEKVYRDFQAAKSKGAFFLLYIKGRYEFRTE